MKTSGTSDRGRVSQEEWSRRRCGRRRMCRARRVGAVSKDDPSTSRSRERPISLTPRQIEHAQSITLASFIGLLKTANLIAWQWHAPTYISAVFG